MARVLEVKEEATGVETEVEMFPLTDVAAAAAAVEAVVAMTARLSLLLEASDPAERPPVIGERATRCCCCWSSFLRAFLSMTW
jgi:Ni,Fe-hydrogenase I small subunit